MKTHQVCLALLLLIWLAPAGVCQEPLPVNDTVTLPPVRVDGMVSVEEALRLRRSLRNPEPTPLVIAEIGQLCWAAQGVTDDLGHRTAPSARARYPLELYVIAGAVGDLQPGLYRYIPESHALVLVKDGDMRSMFMTDGVGQEWIATAPAIFVVSGISGRMSGMGERGRLYMYVEAGLAAQGFFLQAASMGMGSTFVGGFDPLASRAALGLPEAEEVLAVLPVGRRP